jgi:hypothetical protein
LDGWTKYGVSFYGDYGTGAWCAVFVSWCADQAGVPASKITRSSWASVNQDNPNATYFARGAQTPQAGDLIYYIWDGSGDSYASHVGIVWKVDGTYVHTIEGNTNNDDGEYGGVYKRTRRLNWEQIKGYSRVNY